MNLNAMNFLEGLEHMRSDPICTNKTQDYAKIVKKPSSAISYKAQNKVLEPQKYLLNGAAGETQNRNITGFSMPEPIKNRTQTIERD